MRGSLLVLFGTQTGTAQDIAERIARDAALRGFAVNLAGLDKYEAACLPSEKHDIVVFVMSTTGDGDVPESARSFWQTLLRRDLPLDWLSSLRFTVFGCGDSRCRGR
jgi:sulfite reductase alpha subunit-like flavoprotein